MALNKLSVGGCIRALLLSCIWLCLFLIFFPSIVTVIHTPVVDKRFVPYVETFLMYCEEYGKDCSALDEFKIEIGEMPESYVMKLLGMPFSENVIGVCQENILKITVREDYFNRATPASIEGLVAHEIAHCILDADHDDTHDSIMNSVIQNDVTYVKYYNTLYNELFDCKSDCPDIEFDEEYYK